MGLDKLSRSTASAKAALGPLQDVLCIDSTIVRLHDALARCWPACRTNHTLAAVKLHTVVNVRGGGRRASSSLPSGFTTVRY
jgi:hypothetical protein